MNHQNSILSADFDHQPHLSNQCREMQASSWRKQVHLEAMVRKRSSHPTDPLRLLPLA
ncbi:MAG: hypothetical protein U0930_22595 [Pirellulales bacterium]